ncbi:AAA family ATPase (plasmid) [Mycolicibacterium fortuitum]|nr:AAA family ATPase [Mycolicibacterium fortuitum]
MTDHPTVLILTGLPAAGKTTWANTWRQADPGNREIINRDTLRYHLFGQYSELTQEQEDIVTTHEISLAETALLNGKSIVIDDTNLEPEHLAVWTDLAHRHNLTYQIITIDTPLAECLERNRRRAANGGRLAPEHIIHEMHRTAETSQTPATPGLSPLPRTITP